MATSPTQAEIEDQWKKAIDILETLRAHFDTTHATAGGTLDTLAQALEGDYLPSELASLITQLRSSMSDMVSPSVANQIITPVLYEYAKVIADGDEFGASYRSPGDLFRSLYEFFAESPRTIETRDITFGSPSADVGNTGDGAVSRLGVDENGYDLEACHTEKKWIRCRADQNTGANEFAEAFEIVGEASSFDNLRVGDFGSGDAARSVLYSKHAGSGNGGSLLSNSSFSTYNSGNTPKFTGWTETAGGSNVEQDTTNYYRSHPNATTDASLKITGDATLTQSLSAMRIRRVDPTVPYFLRAMVNPTIGTASGGTFTMSLGSVDVDTTIAAMSSGWQEIIVPIGANCWPRNFNEADFAIELKWASSSSGYLLVDDLIFCPWDLVDGTYWLIRGNDATPVSWMLDDLFTVEDTGGAPGTGKLQYWLWRAGFGYLPSSDSPDVTDPA